MQARGHQACRSAHHRHHHRFRQQLPHQPPSARSKGDTERQFPAAIRRARRKQAGQIRARRHEHQQSQPGHAIKKSANDVTGVRVKSWTDQPQRHSGVCLWILLCQLRRDCTQVFRSLLGRHAWLEPAKHRQRPAGTILQVLRVRSDSRRVSSSLARSNCSVPWNRAGATPTTVNGSLPSRTVVPTTPGSALNAVRQRLSLNTI